MASSPPPPGSPCRDSSPPTSMVCTHPVPHPSCPLPCPASLSSLLPTAPCSSSPLYLLLSLVPPPSPLTEASSGSSGEGSACRASWLQEHWWPHARQSAFLAHRAVSSLPLPLLLLRLCASGQAFAKQNYRALRVMICPFPYSRWLEAESTALPRSPAPRHVRRRWLFLPSSCCQPETPAVTLPTGGHRGRDPLQWALITRPQIKSQLRAWAERRRPDQLVQENSIWGWLAFGCPEDPKHNISHGPERSTAFSQSQCVCTGGRGSGGLLAEHVMQLCYFNLEIPFSPTHVHFAPTYYGLALSCLVIFEVARVRGHSG